MNRTRSASGFTLIELLVVIGILATLASALLLTIGRSQERAGKNLDRIKLIQLYGQLLQAREDRAPLPPNGGHELVYYPWVAGAIERTPEDLEARFAAGSLSPRLGELRAHPDLRTVFTRYDEITSADTDFAGRAAEHYAPRMFTSGYEPLLASDNEHGNTYADGSVLVLYGSGAVREIRGAPDEVLEVGPGSTHADLRKLSR